jgi:hypothetical protein
MNLSVFAASWLLVAGPLAGADAPTYQIKLRTYPETGKQVTHSSTETYKKSVKKFAKGKVIEEQTDTETRDRVYTVQTVLKDNGMVKLFKKTFAKATDTRDKVTTALPYEGRTLIYEKKGTKFEVRAEAGPALPAKVLKELQSASTMTGRLSLVFMPTKEIAVGDTWQIDPAKLVQALNSKAIDAAKSTGQGKLIKTYKKDQRQYGVVAFDLDVAVTSYGPHQLQDPLHQHLKLTIDGCIDGSTTEGSVTMKSTIHGTITVKEGNDTFTIDIRVESAGNMQTSAEK